jgi:hypothetical protein
MRRLMLALCLAALIALAFPGVVFGSHARPKSATPLSFKRVPAFQQCDVPNGTHGSPLALPSCNPSAQEAVSDDVWLTWNAPDRPAPYNTAANGSGSVTLKVTCVSSINPPVENGDTPPCNANSGDQLDLKITLATTDIRCVGNPGQAPCAGGTGVAGAGSLYNG